MKIIDEKGKIFGKINIIDLIFLIIIVVAIVGGVFRLKDSTIVAETSEHGTVTLMVTNVRDATVDNIKVGQDLYHYDKGVLFGNIKDKNVEPFTNPIDYEDEWIEADVPNRYIVYIDMDVDITETEKSYVIGGEEIRVGNEYRVKSKTSAFTGTCVGIQVDKVEE